MAVIKKKCWPEYFEAVVSGKKKYELRLNDFEVNGRKVEKKVTYVGRFKIDQLFWPEEQIKEKGIQIISLE